MGFWLRVAQQAWEETFAEIAASPLKALQLLTPVLGAVIAWYALRDAGAAPPYAAMVSLAALLIVALLGIVWKLASIPARMASGIPLDFVPYDNKLRSGRTVVGTSMKTPHLEPGDKVVVFPELRLTQRISKGQRFRYNAEMLELIEEGGSAWSQQAGQDWTGMMAGGRFKILGSLPVFVKLPSDA